MDYKQLFLKVPQPIVLVGTDFTILDATEKYLEVTMQSRENLIGKNMLRVFPDNPDDPESKNAGKLRQSLQKVVDTKKPDHLDVMRYDIPKPGGGFAERYWEAEHQPVLDSDGRVLYVIQNTSDVTEREIAKKELSESEDKFRFLADSLPLLVDTNDSQGKSTYFNASWSRYTGISSQNLINGKWEDAIHADDLKNASKCWDEAFEKGRSCQLEFRIRDKEGDYRWHLNRYMPMADENGRVIMWVGTATDIHDTKVMVEELLQTNEQMNEMAGQIQQSLRKTDAERKVLHNLIMHAPAFCCILRGPGHVFELVNDEYQKLFPGRDLLNKPILEALPEIDGQGYIDLLDKVYSSGEEYTAKAQLVKINRNNKPEEIYVTFIYQPIYDEMENITGILVFGYEVTDQIKAHKTLDKSGDSETIEAQ